MGDYTDVHHFVDYILTTHSSLYNYATGIAFSTLITIFFVLAMVMCMSEFNDIPSPLIFLSILSFSFVLGLSINFANLPSVKSLETEVQAYKTANINTLSPEENRLLDDTLTIITNN